CNRSKCESALINLRAWHVDHPAEVHAIVTHLQRLSRIRVAEGIAPASDDATVETNRHSAYGLGFIEGNLHPRGTACYSREVHGLRVVALNQVCIRKAAAAGYHDGMSICERSIIRRRAERDYHLVFVKCRQDRHRPIRPHEAG